MKPTCGQPRSAWNSSVGRVGAILGPFVAGALQQNYQSSLPMFVSIGWRRWPRAAIILLARRPAERHRRSSLERDCRLAQGCTARLLRRSPAPARLIPEPAIRPQGATMQDFAYQAAPMRVMFGSRHAWPAPGRTRAPRHRRARWSWRRRSRSGRAGRRRGHARRARGRVFARRGDAHAGGGDRPRHGVRERAARTGVVAIGGGSTTGLGKAIALRTDLPQIVVPTSYAGSEMTPILGETSDGVEDHAIEPKSAAGERSSTTST